MQLIKLVTKLSFILLAAHSFPALACEANPVITSISIVLNVNPTIAANPKNRYLTEWIDSGNKLFYDGCTNGDLTIQGMISLPLAGSNIDGYSIYKTNIPGVGVILKGIDQENNGYPLLSDWTTIVTGTSDQLVASFGARLVSITETIQSGEISDQEMIGTVRVVDTPEIPSSGSITLNLVVNGNITSKTCSVSTNSKNISVPLGKVNSNVISTDGSSLIHSGFTINLDSCSTGLMVNMTFTDSNNPANTSDVLSLTNDGNQATGVGIRITNQTTMQPVSYGLDSALAGNLNQLEVIMTSETTVSIPFSATYVKTGSAAIVGGTANGLATFTMSYQ